MTARLLMVSVLVCLATGALGLFAEAAAGPIPIPEYLEGAHFGFVCLNATPPGSGPVTVLLQFTFDPEFQGGIAVGRANALQVNFTIPMVGIFSPALGANPGRCGELLPSLVPAVLPGVDAFAAAQQLSASFQQLGFQRYYIVDVYRSAYAGDVESIVRAEVFRALGADALSYVQGIEIAEPLLP
jgi:hypothetical protein